MPNLYAHLPDSSGVYIMRGGRSEILYIGKAGNLKRRVSSYFLKSHDSRIQKLVSEIKKIEHNNTDTALEALILEARLIHEHQPPYNVLGKDDKSFLYVQITREAFPRVLLARGHEKDDPVKSHATRGITGRVSKLTRFGPFISASQVRYALKLLRRIFPWSVHPNISDTNKSRIHANDANRRDFSRNSHGFALSSRRKELNRPCFDYEIGLCPGTCVGAITKQEYRKNIKNLIRFFEGKKKIIIRSLEKEMAAASKAQEYEQAGVIKRQLFALRHIQDSALLSDSDILNPIPQTPNPIRIEGYDISNISGTAAVGSMVVFVNGEPAKDQYRKFKIRTIMQSNDVGMLKEVLRRRFKHIPPAGGWPLPSLILIDGGKPQVNAARMILGALRITIPVVGIAKGPTRKKNEFIGAIPKGISEDTLISVRDEAHRFAIGYHRTLRAIRSLGR